MPKKINRQSLELLLELADYRMLTLSQIAVLRFGSKRSARRRMQELHESGLVEMLPVRLRCEVGRPEGIYGLSIKGYQEIQKLGLLDNTIPVDLTTSQNLLHQGGHQILLNWVRAHLVHLNRHLPRIVVQFRSCNSPLSWLIEKRRFLLNDEVEMKQGKTPEKLIPDGVFIITDTMRQISALFFLEVDCGTEPLRGGDPVRSDIERKIWWYQQYYATTQYKRYEHIFGDTTLNGFRLLFMTNTDSRLGGLCSLVRGMPPADFIWLTTEDRMRQRGISGFIWHQGGLIDEPMDSILGSLAQDFPLPNLDN